MERDWKKLHGVRTVCTSIRTNGGRKEVRGRWDEYEWTGSGDGLSARSEGKGSFQMVPEILASRIGRAVHRWNFFLRET